MVALGLTVSACGIKFIEHAFEDDHTVSNEFTSVRMQNGSGDVTIRHVEGISETKIHRRVQHPRDNKPGAVHGVDGSTLVLRECGLNNCSIDYEISVPAKNITVTGDLGSGDVKIDGLESVELTTGSGKVETRNIAGKVKVETGSGDFTADGVGGDVHAVLGSGHMRLSNVKGKTNLVNHSGDIDGTGLDADVTADSDSGRVTLKLMSKHAVRATADSGDIDLWVPGGPYKVDVNTGSGDSRITVPTDPSASPELVLRSGSGDIAVNPA